MVKRNHPIARHWASLGVAALVLAGCSSNYDWAWYTVLPTHPQGWRNIKFLFTGFQWTVALTIVSIVIAMVLGIILAVMALSSSRPLRAASRAYVEAFRSVPPLVLILWVYYGLPVLIGINFEPFMAGVISLALADSAFQAEVFRAGLQSIERGQHEAADSLGLSFSDKFRFIILPQAVRRVLPALGNQLVLMLKMSSLVSIIGLTELTRRANELTSSIYRPLEVYSFLVLEYLVLVLVVSYFVRRLEHKMGANQLMVEA